MVKNNNNLCICENVHLNRIYEYILYFNDPFINKFFILMMKIYLEVNMLINTWKFMIILLVRINLRIS